PRIETPSPQWMSLEISRRAAKEQRVNTATRGPDHFSCISFTGTSISCKIETTRCALSVPFDADKDAPQPMMKRLVQPEILDSLPHHHPAVAANRRDLFLINRIMGNFRWIGSALKLHLA